MKTKNVILAVVAGLAASAGADYDLKVRVDRPTHNEDGTISQNFGAERDIYRVVCQAEINPHLGEKGIQQSRCYADGSIFGEMDGIVDAVYLGRMHPLNKDPTIECLIGNQYDPAAECASFRPVGEVAELTAHRPDISFSPAKAQKIFDSVATRLGFERAQTEVAASY